VAHAVTRLVVALVHVTVAPLAEFATAVHAVAISLLVPAR
jgi:hypothetical protein